MSEINANITVEPYNIDIIMESPNMEIVAEPIILNFSLGGYVAAGGNNGDLQYNVGNSLGGIPTANYINGNLSLGNVANLKILGGTNQYFLQTDGTGNLTWQAGTGNATGNGTVGGANTQIQFNDSANFGGAAGFTFNKVSNVTNLPGNIDVAGNANIIGNILAGNLITSNFYTGTLTTGNQSNITTIGNLTSLNVNGNLFTTGTTTVQQAKEKVTISSNAATGTVNFDVLDQAILYITANASNNFTLNIRGNSTTTLNNVMSNSQSLTIAFLNTNGATPYYANVIQIDSSNITPKYVLNYTPTSGTSTGIDQYIYNIIKTGTNTYTVLGSKIGFL